ncbi:sodium:calcium antiporter [Novosphingobium sp. SG707]|uniref:sodium:calcium antiporter n=1 Tax=Novosphingobium sp. SG707 TaxID=2586996 RepID=UPI001444C410|nr:sodium:calcium antiporter [Novosphingobium sp. SG707]NKI98649.1 cation:H+ antiporter [Novosphingobium sp. SG707]
MSSLTITIALLLGSAVVIYLACEYFVNGVEWVGEKMDVGQKATGTILAAFGTALPESVVTLVAVAFGTGAAAKELGVGAALGGPLALSTIAYATVGVVLLLTGRRLAASSDMAHTFRHLSKDQGWFLAIFAAKITLGLLAFAWKPWLGVLFLAAYALYVRQELGGEGDDAEEGIEPLKFQPGRAVPATAMAVFQVLVALVVIFVASQTFVRQLEALGPALGLRPQLLALLFSPIATELPETMNAIIWVRQGKYKLALANISGAMMIQATIPTALGLFFTPWLLTPPLLVAAGATMAAILIMFLVFRRGMASRGLLAGMGLLYLVFAGVIAALHLG